MAFRRPLATLIVGVALVLAQGALQQADACTTPQLLAVVTSPRDTETNVPTNAVIDIHVFGDSIPADIASQFSLWQDETRVNLLFTPRTDSSVAYITAVRLIPCPTCLFANQTYQVRQGTSVTDPLVATFRVGNSPDPTIPPPLTGASASVNGFDTHPDGGSDCFSERIRQVRLSVPNVGKPVVYTLKEGNQVISADDVSLIGTFYCSGQPHWQGDTSWVVSPGQHIIQLSAIDRVGNSSIPVDVSFDANCIVADGGTSDGGSGNGTLPGDTNTTVPVQPSSGC